MSNNSKIFLSVKLFLTKIGIKSLFSLIYLFKHSVILLIPFWIIVRFIFKILSFLFKPLVIRFFLFFKKIYKENIGALMMQKVAQQLPSLFPFSFIPHIARKKIASTVGILLLFSSALYSAHGMYSQSKWMAMMSSNAPQEKTNGIKVTLNTSPTQGEPQKSRAYDFSIAAEQSNNNASSFSNGDMIILDGSNDEQMRTSIETYTVQSGDTLASIAKKFDIKIETILVENKLTSFSIIRPGQELRILPLDGISYKIKKGDTIAAIAKTYRGNIEDILDFNNLADANDVFPGDELIIPQGKIPPPPVPRAIARNAQSKEKLEYIKQYGEGKITGQGCRRFIGGQCTYWVAKKRCIPWTGNAKDWIRNAKASGFPTGNEPRVGAIVTLKETGWAARRYGHVAYVEEVTDTTITFSEMNFKGPWIVTRRTLERNSPKIVLPYIYE